jgi:hypothetical protein
MQPNALRRLARFVVPPVLALCGIGPPAPGQTLPSSPTATFAYAALGSGLGQTRIAVSTSGGAPEMYLGGYAPFWVALRFNPATHQYDQTFVSRAYDVSNLPGTRVARIAVADVAGGSGEEIVVALTSGRIVLYDRTTKAEVASFPSASSSLGTMNTCDVDGDGQSEILVLGNAGLSVHAGTGTLLWSVPGLTGSDVLGGQFDADPTPEIVVGDGIVVDAATHGVQWNHGTPFGTMLERGDIDQDGRDELLAGVPWSGVTAYDVDTQSVKWSIPPSIGGTQSILLTDLDGDGRDDLLIGDAQWGEVHIVDTATQVETGFLNNPEHGVTALAAADLDQDGATEVVWAAGATSSGSDFVYVANPVSHQVEWQSIDLEGPFVGPLRGDLDGDGLPEIVAVSTYSNSGYQSGRILVFDGQTHALRAVSPPICGGLSFTGTHDALLADVDHDGEMEIVVGADRLYDGRIEIYDFDAAGNFTLAWTNATSPSGAPFYSVAVADVDQDGDLEIVGGVGRAHTGAVGIFVYVYDYATHAEQWHSGQIGAFWDAIERVFVRNTDPDASPEIVAQSQGSTGITVLDGITQAQEGVIPGSFTSSEIVRVDGPNPVRLIAAGDGAGGIAFYRSAGGAYVQVAAAAMSASAIDGITAPFRRLLLTGSAGKLRAQRALSPSLLWESEPYGSTIGARAIYLPGSSPTIYTCSSYAVLGF